MSEVPNPNPKVVFVTAGGAGMYCGSCMRDNTLVRNLMAMGWNIELVPAYTPVRTDEENVSIDQVVFGGVNMFLQQKIPLFRWLPRWMDRWLDNPKLLKSLTSKSIKIDPKQLGKMTLATVEGESGILRKEHRRFVDFLREHSKPDLVNLTNLLIGGCIPLIRRQLPGKPILVTLQGDDLFLNQLTEPWKTRVLMRMREVAKEVDGFVTFNQYYADFMGEQLLIPPEKFHIVPLGVETEDFLALEREPGRPPTVGFFARISPEKGFHNAVDAFIELHKIPGMQDARLLAGGWLGANDQEFYEAQIAKLKAANLEAQFHYIGSPDRDGKLQFFREIDVFSVPTDYHEPKGLYVLEALAAGLPVVQPKHGAFVEMLGENPAAVLVQPGEPQALANAWSELLANEFKRLEMGKSGRNLSAEKLNAAEMARRTAETYQKFC
ncbi:MAG: glycosyltransferase involved in cell wall biosynthesis [Verrucomicrobiales bacterium]|jgi:glycosyltransferase involved in cell wall biosynthesis